MTITHGSLFSGVGGFDLGADKAGIKTLWQCEISTQPTSVLKRHWPNVKRYKDVNDVKGNEIDPVDIISFGSPCQDLSVAGKRKGLTGDRSGLFHQGIRIAKEMLDATEGQYPRFLIWENVRGALSSNNGDDFETVIQEMASIGAVDVSYRLLNAANFGVPQRRVRVFVIADFRGECAGEILSKPTRVLWHPTQSKQKGKGTTNEVTESTGNSECYRFQSFGEYKDTDRASAIKERDYKDATDLVLSTTYSKAKRATSTEDYETWKEGIVSPTLNAMDNTGESFATVIAIQDARDVNKKQNGLGINDDAKVMYTIDTASEHAVLSTAYKVRRLTPRECERLMGWPDDHTRYDSEGNELSDSARYKMCGNGIASPVAQWVCENIVEVLSKE